MKSFKNIFNLKNFFLKQALDLLKLPLRKVPIPFVDNFARDLAYGRLKRPMYTLKRVLLEHNINEPQALLGVNFWVRPSDPNISRRNISNIYEPINVIFGPSYLAGRPLASIPNEALSGRLVPEQLKIIDLNYLNEAMGSVTTTSRLDLVKRLGERFARFGLTPPRNILLEAVLRNAALFFPVETVPLVDPRRLSVPQFTEKQIKEVIDRYNLLQQIRAAPETFPPRIFSPTHRHTLDIIYELLQRRGPFKMDFKLLE